MTASVEDVAAYLAASHWRSTNQFWRGARVWMRDGYEVLVPARNNLGDHDARIRDLVEIVAGAESRPPGEVLRDIAHPLVDTATYRMGNDNADAVALLDGLQVVGGLRDLLGAAARVVVEGPHLRFRGRTPAVVDELLTRVELARPVDGGAGVTLMVPVSGRGAALRGRDVAVQLHDAVTAVEEAIRTGQVEAFDSTVTAGVSADLCVALSALAGSGNREPFELGFRWAHGLPADVSSRLVPFLPDSGLLTRAAAARLRRLRVTGRAVALGVVDGQHDEAGGADRWRIRVRGELQAGSEWLTGARRLTWARLPDQETYDRALEAYRVGQRVRIDGQLTSQDGRVELSTRSEGMHVMEDQGPEDQSAQ